MVVRDDAFRKAEQWIMDVRDGEAPPTPMARKFQNRPLPENCRDARVDIEINHGTAFCRAILRS
jgi:hypothetical protein